MARAQGARSQLAAAFESVYGTAPGSGFTKLPFASITLGSAQPLLASELLGYGRDPLAPIKDAVTTDGDIVVPLDAEGLGYWLKAAFGAPTTTGSGVATGTIIFSDNPDPGDTITLGGTVWTFVSSSPSSAETEIDGTLTDTLTALVLDLNNSADTEIAKCTYSVSDGDTIEITFDVSGAAGNAFTIAASAAAPSGASLAGGGSSHVFKSGSWALPSLAIEKGLPDVPRFEMFTGCVVNSLSWQMQRSGLLTGTVNIIAQGEASGTSSVAGTLGDITLARFGHFNGSIKREGAALGNVISTEITYSNNLDRIETIRADGKIDGADPSMATLTGSTVMRFADTTLLQQALDGDPCELEFAYAVGGNSFSLVAHAVYLPRPRVEISGPAGVQVTLEWQAALDPVEGQMCTATLVNGVGAY
ncbi:MAG: phage tail tube protein [Mesorhizobium sp.]|jgi:hypothetical protein